MCKYILHNSPPTPLAEFGTLYQIPQQYLSHSKNNLKGAVSDSNRLSYYCEKKVFIKTSLAAKVIQTKPCKAIRVNQQQGALLLVHSIGLGGIISLAVEFKYQHFSRFADSTFLRAFS